MPFDYIIACISQGLPRTDHRQRIKVFESAADNSLADYNDGSSFCRRLHRLVRWTDKGIRQDADFRQDVGSLFSQLQVIVCTDRPMQPYGQDHHP